MIYLVTGLMRSGTSFLASELHRMGVPMGSLMQFPAGDADPDWEDVAFTTTLANGLLAGEKDCRSFFSAYIRARGHGRWGVKSPFALPFVAQFFGAAKDGGHAVRLFLTSRSEHEAKQSLDAKLAHVESAVAERVRGLQRTLAESWQAAHAVSDAVFDCDESRKSPDLVRGRLCGLVGGASWA